MVSEEKPKHEIAHPDGILFLDRLDRPEDLREASDSDEETLAEERDLRPALAIQLLHLCRSWRYNGPRLRGQILPEWGCTVRCHYL